MRMTNKTMTVAFKMTKRKRRRRKKLSKRKIRKKTTTKSQALKLKVPKKYQMVVEVKVLLKVS